MGLLFDSFWRAVAYCLMPRVIVMSLAPLVLMAAFGLGVAYLFWVPAIDAVREGLAALGLDTRLWSWLDAIGAGGLKTVLPPLIVIFLATPIVVISSLVMVALVMTPAIARYVAERRFPTMERRRGASLIGSVWWSLLSMLLALAALVVSVPLWFLPPLVLVLPPLIWGWLTYRVMAFDAVAEFADREERIALMNEHRAWLMMMGVICGFLGGAPSLVWASGALFAAFMFFLIPIAIWIYTLIFVFASLWFSHFMLAALQRRRAQTAAAAAPQAAPGAGDVVDVAAREVPSPEALAWRDESARSDGRSAGLQFPP